MELALIHIANHNDTGSALRNIIGILHSIAKAITVREFLRQGAGIALQMKQARSRVWDDRAAPFRHYVSCCLHFSSLNAFWGETNTEKRIVG